MRITWHGHSCFRIDSAEGSFVFDPYEDGSVPGLAPLRLTADAVFCSHDHHDHNAARLVTLTGREVTPRVRQLRTYHDDKHGLLRGKNTVTLLTVEGMTAAHMGDIGHIPSKADLEALRGADIMMIPVGGFYTIDAAAAKRLIDLTQPRIVFPMHYRLGKMGYDVIADLAEFTALCDNVVYTDTDTVEITRDTPSCTMVVKYNG